MRAVLVPVGAHVRGKRVDVGGIVVIVVNRAHRRRIDMRKLVFAHAVQTGRRRLGGILREHGHDEDATDAVGLHPVEDGRRRRAAVAHGPVDRNPELSLKRPGRAPRVHDERRAFVGPDASVSFGGLLRTRAQNDAVQNRPPLPSGKLDDAPVAEEFGQIAADGLFGRGVGAPRIDQKKRDFVRISHGTVRSGNGFVVVPHSGTPFLRNAFSRRAAKGLVRSPSAVVMNENSRLGRTLAAAGIRLRCFFRRPVRGGYCAT